MKSLSLLPLQLLLLTTCTLRAQGKRRQVYFREEFEDGGKRSWTREPLFLLTHQLRRTSG